MLSFTVFGKAYDVSNAPEFVRYAIRLMIERWGANFDLAPTFVAHKANLLGKRWG